MSERERDDLTVELIKAPRAARSRERARARRRGCDAEASLPPLPSQEIALGVTLGSHPNIVAVRYALVYEDEVRSSHVPPASPTGRRG